MRMPTGIKGAEAAMDARAELDPFLWRLRAQSHDAAAGEQEREKSDPEMQVHRGAFTQQFRLVITEAQHGVAATHARHFRRFAIAGWFLSERLCCQSITPDCETCRHEAIIHVLPSCQRSY